MPRALQFWGSLIYSYLEWGCNVLYKTEGLTYLICPGLRKTLRRHCIYQSDNGFVHKSNVGRSIDLNLTFCILTLNGQAFSTILYVLITWLLCGTYGSYLILHHVRVYDVFVYRLECTVVLLHMLLEFYCVIKLVGNDPCSVDYFWKSKYFSVVYSVFWVSVKMYFIRVYKENIRTAERRARVDGKERKLAQTTFGHRGNCLGLVHICIIFVRDAYWLIIMNDRCRS